MIGSARVGARTASLVVVLVICSAGLALNAAPAVALSKNVFSTTFAGSGPTALTNPTGVAVDQSTGDVYVSNTPVNEQQTLTIVSASGTGDLLAGSTEITNVVKSTGAFAVGQTISAPGLRGGGTKIVSVGEGTITIADPAIATATGAALATRPEGTFTLTFDGHTTGPISASPESFPFAVEQALAKLPNVGSGNVHSEKPTSTSFAVEFPGAAFRGAPQPLLTADPAGLTGGASAVTVARTRAAIGVSDIEKFDPSGNFLLILGQEVNATSHGDLCTAASGETCQHGSIASSPGAFETPEFLAVDNSSGPSAGDLYVADRADHLISKFDSSGGLIDGWGANGQLDGSAATFGPFDSRGLELGGVAVGSDGTLYVSATASQFFFFKFAQDGTFIASVKIPSIGSAAQPGFAVDSSENLYARESVAVDKFSSGGRGFGATAVTGSITGGFNNTQQSALALDESTRDLYVDRPNGTVQHFAGSCVPTFEAHPTAETPCAPLDTFGAADLARGPQGVAIDEATDTVYVADPGHDDLAVFSALPYLPNAAASAAPPATHSESFTGTVDPAGAGPITACHFDYGTDTTYGLGSLPCEATPPLPYPGGTTTAVHAEAGSGLEYGTTYHYRLLAANSNGANASFDQTFTTLPLPPAVTAESVSEVHADAATVHVQINPNGGGLPYPTSYVVEYVDDATFQEDLGSGDGFQHASHTASAEAGSAKTPQSLIEHLSGLNPATTYHYRVLATNAASPPGGNLGPVRTFTTLPFGVNNDPCPNAHVRQQTSAGQLLDCRAYELVSAANAGGYDVESSLVSGQQPFANYPDAAGRVLYGVHGGGIPGAAHPTNRGVDPYLAVRGAGGWSTEYVGVPADNPFSAAPFSSLPSATDAGLQTFAFGAPGGCSPCFEGGYTGVPIRLPSGDLVQGMAPSAGVTPPPPTATTDGYVARPLSANGAHFVFGSESQFESAGNDSNGNVSIYDRDLATEETRLVSRSPTGAKLPCLQGTGACHSPGDPNGIAELDISNDGSRILLAQKVSEDSDGNVLWHLYMDVGDAKKTVDLTPNTTAGALYDGMTADGSRVFFTTTDKLGGGDADESADLYEARLNPEGTATSLNLVSTGPSGPSNSDACSPSASEPGHAEGEHWNTITAQANCGVLAIGGGGGVASESGAIYFLSPEKLSEPGAVCGIPCAGQEPVPDQPNLYLATPGSAPRYIATLEPDNPLVLDAARESGTRHTADFQLAPSGEFAAFPSTLALAGGEEETQGHAEIYRYDAATEKLACASCSPTGEASTAEATLAQNGLSLTDDGQVFFTTAGQLAVADTDAKQDAYEWEPQGTGNCQPASATFGKTTASCLALISAGTSAFDSALLGASADGTDAYFFTRDSLAPADQNGPTMKIYDARAQGGFPYSFPAVGCKASDECHGAASPAPGPLQVGSETVVPPGPTPCKKGFVRRHGKCVKQKHHHRKPAKHHRGAGK